MLFVWTVIANLHNRRSELTLMVEKTFAAEGIRIPDGSLAREMHPVIALVTAGVEMDVLKAMQRLAARGGGACTPALHFKEDTIQASFDGIKHKLETTFVNADVLADRDPHC